MRRALCTTVDPEGECRRVGRARCDLASATGGKTLHVCLVLASRAVQSGLQRTRRANDERSTGKESYLLPTNYLLVVELEMLEHLGALSLQFSINLLALSTICIFTV